jgi:hypothetical protein
LPERKEEKSSLFAKLLMSLFKRVLFFLIDGASQEVMAELINKGELPNIAKYLVEISGMRTAVTCFPSTTGPAFTPPMTGCFPGTCNIPGVRWFDRSLSEKKIPTLARFRNYYDWGIYRFDSDLSKNVSTLYEEIPDSVSILGFLNRGTKFSQKKHFFKSPYIFFRAVQKDDVHYVEREALRYFKTHVKKMPQFVFYYFPIVDLYSHKYRKNSQQVKDCYHRIDKDIGEIITSLKQEGVFGETLLILTADHGHGDVENHLDVDSFLEEKFKKVLFYPSKFRNWKNAEAINMVSGNCMTHIYVRANGTWPQHTAFEALAKSGLTESLLEKPEVAFVMGRSENGGMIVKSKRGEAHIREKGDAFYYQPKSADPFEYPALPSQMKSQEALKLTYESNFPDAVVQSAQLFRSPRAGDLVLVSEAGCDLRAAHHETPEHLSGHGNLTREQMIVPFYSNHAFPKQMIRTADIFPTILHSLGIDTSHLTLDGVSLLNA